MKKLKLDSVIHVGYNKILFQKYLVNNMIHQHFFFNYPQLFLALELLWPVLILGIVSVLRIGSPPIKTPECESVICRRHNFVVLSLFLITNDSI